MATYRYVFSKSSGLTISGVNYTSISRSDIARIIGTTDRYGCAVGWLIPISMSSSWSIGNSNYKAYSLTGDYNYQNPSDGTYTIPSGSYFGSFSTSNTHGNDDGTESDHTEYGIDDCCILASPSISFSSAESFLADYTDEDFYGGTGMDNAIYRMSLFYANTDIKVSISSYSVDDENTYTEFSVNSGSASWVTGNSISNGTTTYSVKTTNSASSGETYYKSYSIDPTAISISGTLTTGKSATISISRPSAGYSGYTIYYTYQYSVNGGSWTNITTSSTSTSCNFTIPTNATSIQVRVQARDSLGSGVYVTSTTYTDITPGSITYTSISGQIKSSTPKVCVGGGGTQRFCCNLQRRRYQSILNCCKKTSYLVAVA